MMHCIMQRVKGGYRLRDKGSTNGIKKNGNLMETINLHDEVELMVGEVALKFKLSDDEVAELKGEAFISAERKKRLPSEGQKLPKNKESKTRKAAKKLRPYTGDGAHGPAGPNNKMRTLAIGDVHGCCNALKTLVDHAGISKEDTIVTLGDYIDRGPDSKGVIDFLIKLNKSHRLVTLKGNHELMMENARDSVQEFEFWSYNGGAEALESFDVSNSPSFYKEIPKKYWNFMAACKPYHETASHILVHGGLDAEADLEDQSERHLYWQRIFESKPHKSGKIMVCGHTPQHDGRPLVSLQAICIDTFACGGGWLTCLDIDSGEYWQANDKGETRKGRITIPV